MDYEKKYKEALEKARQLYAYPTSNPFISDLQDLFPELKESEDERIMGNIIATIHLYYGEPLDDEAKEMIAWLEKQSQTFTKKDVDDAYIDSLQEEPVSKDFETALAEMVAKAQKCVVEPWVVAAQWKDELIKLAKSEEPVSEQNLSNVERTVKEWKEPVSEDLELTWEDMRELYVIFAEVDTEIKLCKADDIKAETIGYFQEVSKRFKDYKERKEK